MKSLTLAFNNNTIHANNDAWFNATDMARAFNKRPADWLMQRDTIQYLATLYEVDTGKSDFLSQFNKIKPLDGISSLSQSKLLKLAKQTGYIKVKSGSPANGGGTWLHRKLVIRFAQWLDVRFAIWCDNQIEQILSGERLQARNDTKASNRLMNKVLHLAMQSQGQEAKHYHYSNNVLMCYEIMTGTRMKVDRDSLPAHESKLLSEIELDNTSMTMQGMDYHERKKALTAKYSVKLSEVAA